MLMVAAMNLYIAFNSNITCLEYFGYEIRITPGYRLMCLFGGILMTLIFFAMVVGSIVDKVKANRAHSVCRMTEAEWNEFCSQGRVSPELKEKTNKADSMSLDELEHLSDKKD